MITESALKEQLRGIAQDEYRVPDGVDHWELSLAMMQYLGAPDPELRDDLIYRTLLKWTVNGVLSNEKLRVLRSMALDEEHLFFGLGEQDTDSVFTRAFSLLVIVLPLYVHRRNSFLTELEVRDTSDKVLRYLPQEKDLRGYVEGKGWAHATAHAADVLDELALCDEIDRLGLVEMLAAIRAKMSTPNTVFHHEEDERMAYATLSLFQRGLLTDGDIEEWIRSFAPIEATGRHSDVHRRVNVKNYLSSLYFQSLHRRLSESIQQPINETLYAISRFK